MLHFCVQAQTESMLSYLKQSTALGMAQTSRVKYEHQIAKVNTHIETEKSIALLVMQPGNVFNRKLS